jgi:hypothetical protein
MRRLRLVLSAFLCLMAAGVKAAGFGFIDVPADPAGPAMRGAVWSPCAISPQDVVVDRTTLPGVKDCPIAGDKLPLVHAEPLMEILSGS